MIEQVVSGSNITQFNGPVMLPIWDGLDGTRQGQIAYDADGEIDTVVGPSIIYWDGAAWMTVGAEGSSVINQFLSTQTGNFILSGRGAASNFSSVRADNAAFQAYYGFTRDAIDDTKKIWDFGVTGVPIAGSGPTVNLGGDFSIRSYTVSGAFIRDVISSSRNGRITIPNTLIVGTGTATATGVLTVIGNAGVNGGLACTSVLRHGSGLWQNGTITVTGDYSAFSDEMYINVNNTANCTITIAAANTAFPGRVFYIKKTIDNEFTVTIVVQGGVQTIDGSGSAVLTAYNSSIMLHDDGANWFIY